MKNFPNQISDFERIRAGLQVIKSLQAAGRDPSVSEVLGYECARRGVYTFRGLSFDTATKAQIEAAIKEMKAKDYADQGPLTFARDLRRTLRFLGWIDGEANLTHAGDELLATDPFSVEEQAVLVEGLMNIRVPDRTEKYWHHPTPVLLKLLADAPSYRREGLELAFQPQDDSDAEFDKALAMYPMPRDQRIKAMATTTSQRANAVKILPKLCIYAGLIVESNDHYLHLSQDGWALIDQPKTPSTGDKAKKSISKRPRRTTVGRKVTSDTIAKKINTKLPRTLSAEEQKRAAERLNERTADHQALVTRMAKHIGDDDGTFFEDQYSYDMLWVSNSDAALDAFLFEMKTVTDEKDAHVRVRSAVGQLSYYDYFHAGARLKGGRQIQRVVVVDTDLPVELKEYLTHEGVAAILHEVGKAPVALNSLGQSVLDQLP